DCTLLPLSVCSSIAPAPYSKFITRSSVKAAAMALAYFLQTARVPVPAPALSTGLLEAAVRQLDPEHRVTYQGQVLLVLDPTESEKRSRARGKCGRQREHLGRVRRSKGPPPKTKGPAPKDKEEADPRARSAARRGRTG